MEDIYRKEIEKLKPTYKPRWRWVLRAFFKYIFTRKIRIWVGFYVLLVLVFYFLVKKNLAISMFFAFVVWGIVLRLCMGGLEENWRLYFLLFAPHEDHFDT